MNFFNIKSSKISESAEKESTITYSNQKSAENNLFHKKWTSGYVKRI